MRVKIDSRQIELLLEEVDELVSRSYKYHQVDKDLAVKDRQKAFDKMYNFLKELTSEEEISSVSGIC